MGCKKCCKMMGLVLVLLGLAFLSVDLGYWDFWGLNWWTVTFLFMGLAGLCKSHCKMCMKK